MKPRKVNENHLEQPVTSLKVLIFYASIGSGHLSAARSIREALLLSGAGQVTLADALPPRANRAGFTSLLSAVSSGLLPGIYTRAWENGSMSVLFDLSARFPWIRQRVLQSVQDAAPDVVVCTHALPCAILARQPARAYRLLAVATDFQAHAYWPVQGVDGYVVAGQEACDRLRQRGMPPQRVEVLGIPVRPQFTRQPVGIAITGGSGVRPLRVLVIAGGARTGPYLPVLPKVDRLIRALSDRPMDGVEWCFIFGSSRWLHRRAEKHLAGRADITLLGLTDDMADKMAWADVVATKAGGLSLAESFAMGRPVLILRRGAGQEAANTDIVMQTGAGMLVKSAEHLLQTVASFAQNRETLAELTCGAAALGRPNAANSIAAWVQAMGTR